MIAIRTILAPTDFSPHAGVAVRYACDLAERLGATLHLLHVLHEPVAIGPDPMMLSGLSRESYRDAEAESREALGRLIQPGWGKPSGLETSVRWGTAVEAIVEEARRVHADLIVVSTHGRTGLSHVLLGSVAERIVREAPCPVLTIRDRETT